VANTRAHAETGEKPIGRFLAAGPPKLPEPSLVREAFRWSATRRVTKTATVSLLANRYEVDPSLIGKNVELRYDPEDLSLIEVFVDGTSVGAAVPFVIGRHVHPAVPQAPAPVPVDPGPGIDYLGLVATAQAEQVGAGISYAEIHLPGFDDDAHDDNAQAQ
jgi:putative transposase